MTDSWTESNIQDIDYQLNTIRRNQECRPRPKTPEDYARQWEKRAAWQAKSRKEKITPYIRATFIFVAFVFLAVPVNVLAWAVLMRDFSAVGSDIGVTLRDMVTFSTVGIGNIWEALCLTMFIPGIFLTWLEESGQMAVAR